MSRFTTTVHIAGEMVNGLQQCVRCGCILTDFRNCMVAAEGKDPPALNGWAFGSFIGETPGCSFIMGHDAQALDEIRCGAMTQ